MTTQAISTGVEKFSMADLAGLREDLKRSQLDNWQLGDVVSHYLKNKGYGVSNEEVREMIARIERTGYSLSSMQEEFEKVARVM